MDLVPICIYLAPLADVLIGLSITSAPPQTQMFHLNMPGYVMHAES